MARFRLTESMESSAAKLYLEGIAMAKRGSSDGWVVLGLSVLVGWVVLSYAKSGMGKNNSPLIPDFVEDPIDNVVGTLNNIFGQNWVTAGIHSLQAQFRLAMPAVAAVVDVVYWVEQHYGHLTGGAKKQLAIGRLGG